VWIEEFSRKLCGRKLWLYDLKFYPGMAEGMEKNKYQSEQPLGVGVNGGLWWTPQ
jgi:hypothetical protein